MLQGLSPQEIMDFIPQKPPFRFIDEILSVNSNEITGTYFFKKDEYFYAGHFPHNPITPGVILLESMCQVGVVAFACYLLSLEYEADELVNWNAFLIDANFEIEKIVYPETKVFIYSKKLIWRLGKIKAEITMFNEQKERLAKAIVSGMALRNRKA